MKWLLPYLRGAASIFDLFGTLGPSRDNGTDSSCDYEGWNADAEALRGDWDAIGSDFWAAIDASQSSADNGKRFYR